MERPWDIGIRVTWRCNLRCIMCDIWKTRPPAEELTTAEICSILDEARDWGVQYFVLSGGEPLLRRDIYDIIEHAARRDVKPCMTTNGVLITREVARRLAGSGLHSMDISLDGASEATADAIRGVPGAYGRTLQAMEHMFKEKDVDLWIATVIMNQNLEELLPLARLAAEARLPIKYQPVVVWDLEPYTQNRNAASSPMWVPPERLGLLDKALDGLIDFKRQYRTINNPIEMLQQMKSYFRGTFDSPCIAGGSMALDSDGSLLPCWYWGAVESVRGGRLREAWDSPALSADFDRMKSCSNKCMLNCHFPADPIDRGLRDWLRGKPDGEGELPRDGSHGAE